MQVADLSNGEPPGGCGSTTSLFTFAQELAISRVGVDHPRARGVEPVGQEENPLLVGQMLGGLEPDIQMAVARPAVGEGFELHEQ